MPYLNDHQKGILRGLITHDSFKVIKQFIEALKIEWSADQIVCDNQWETSVKAISRDAKKEGVDILIKKLYEEIQ